MCRKLCVFDGKTDSKSKLVEKRIVWLCCLDYVVYFVKILICDALCCNLMTMHAKWMWHSLTQGIRTIKAFIKYKKCYYC